LAIENGVQIIEVKKMISCQYYDNFLEEFVEKNNKIRNISPIHKIIGKNNNNTFYGRLGMNPERLEEEYLPEKSEPPKPLPPIGSTDKTYLSNLSDEDLPF
jgi:hypothetical protein